MFLRSHKIESLVGENAKFNGDLVIQGTIRIDGTVLGNINVDWLILGEKAFLRGDVNACGVVVGGKMEGNIDAKEIVCIKNKGNVKGNIRTIKLTVDEGGIIDGLMRMSANGHSEIEQDNEFPKILEFKQDKNRTDKIKTTSFEGIKFEEFKSL